MNAAERGTQLNPAISELHCPARQLRLITIVAVAGTCRATRADSKPSTKIGVGSSNPRCCSQFAAAVSNGFGASSRALPRGGKNSRIDGPAARITGYRLKVFI